MKANRDVPMFAMIMFARDSSEDPYHFMIKHLNAVGDTGGLEQVREHSLSPGVFCMAVGSDRKVSPSLPKSEGTVLSPFK